MTSLHNVSISPSVLYIDSNSGMNNTVIGYDSASNYLSNESCNIILGAGVAGVGGESNTIRFGAGTGTALNQIASTYISGIYGGSTGSTAGIALIDSNDKFGSISGTSSQVLLGGTKPSWGQVDLSTQVTGTLPISRGGTNATSMTTTDGVVYFDGTKLATTSAGTSGQVLTSGGAGVAPSYASLPSTVTSIAGTTNQISASSSTGSVTLSAPSVFIAPGSMASTTSLTAGNGFTVTAGATTLTPFNTSGIVNNNTSGVLSTFATTNHALQVGSSSGQLTQLSPGSTGQLLKSVSSSDPVWTASTYPDTVAQGDVFYASASNVISSLAKNTSATRVLTNTGTSNAPAWAQVNLSTGVTGVLPTANGGTGGTGSATSWTPVLQFGGASVGMTYTTQTGYFQSLGSTTGSFAFFSLQILLSNKGSSSGTATISGLPFSANILSAFIINYNALLATVTNLVAQVSAGSSVISLYVLGLPASSLTFTNTSQLIISGTYITA